MELNKLKPAQGAVKRSKRIARGQGSGKGGTATRGHKGAKSRSGYKNKRGFEGGQMPLQQRVPKRGFTNPNRTVYRVFNLDQLQQISEKYGQKNIDLDFLRKNQFIKRGDVVKVLGSGELTNGLEVSVNAFSASAKEMIESKGGRANII